MKTCTGCGESKPLEMFYRKARSPDGRATRCKNCHNKVVSDWNKKNPDNIREKTNKWRRNNPDKVKAARRKQFLMSHYGVTEDQYLDMLAAQDGRCAVCRTSEFISRWGTPCIDHDHSCCPSNKSCGKCLRGILCANCNTILGLSGDDVNRLRRAIEYLEVHRG